MHNAPPVVFPVGRFVWGPRLACALAILMVGVLSLWLWWSGASVLACAGSASTWAAAAACTVWWMPREFVQQGELAWDGEGWHCQGQAACEGPIHLSLTLDGGSFMLVSLRCMAHSGMPTLPLHAWLRRADMPSRWHGFRCAVYSRQTVAMHTT